MGVPLSEIRQRNRQRIDAAVNGYENDLVGVLSRLPYEDLECWLELAPGGYESAVSDALGGVYETSIAYLRREIARFDLPYPLEAVDGVVPEAERNDGSKEPGAHDDSRTVNDSRLPIEVRYVQLPAEEAQKCAVVLDFVAFAVMKARDSGCTLGHLQTRAWVVNAFIGVVDAKVASIALRMLLELLTSNLYVPPFFTLDVVLESALLVPCGTGSTPQSATESLAEFVESDAVAARVVSRYEDPSELRSVGQHIRGPDATRLVSAIRRLGATAGPKSRVAIVELQVYSLCVLFAVASVHGFDELTSRRAPKALSAVAALTRAPPNELLTPLKVAVADTLRLVLSTKSSEDWPEVYAKRMGLNAQLAAIKDASIEKKYLLDLLSAVSYGLVSVGPSLPVILKIATDKNAPGELRSVAGNCMNFLVRGEDVSQSSLRSHNVYALLVRELSRSATDAANATTDWDAQLAADLAQNYAHLFKFWLEDSRTQELEHALINSDFFEACADLANPHLAPFHRKSTPSVALRAAAFVLDPSQIEPLLERGTVAKFVAALRGFASSNLSKLPMLGLVAFSLWNNETNTIFQDLAEFIKQRLFASPWFWTSKVIRTFVPILERTEPGRQQILQHIDEALNRALADRQDFPTMPEGLGEGLGEDDFVTEDKFQKAAARLAFELLGLLSPKAESPNNAPLDDPVMIRKLFAAAQHANTRHPRLQFYAAQDLHGCVSQFLIDSSEAPELPKFLLALDKVSLAAVSESGTKPPMVPSYENLKPWLNRKLIAASLEAALALNFSVYTEAVLFILKDTQFFPDSCRMEYVRSIMTHCESVYGSKQGSGTIRHWLLFLRTVTVDWAPVGVTATKDFMDTLYITCRIICMAFKNGDEPTRVLAFSILGHLGLSHQPGIPLPIEAVKSYAAVIDAALESESLRAQVVIPPWFGERDSHGFLTKWKVKIPEVARENPDAVLSAASSLSDQEFAKIIDPFFAAGKVALEAISEGKMGDYLELIAGIAERLLFSWVPFEKMGWPGVGEAIDLLLKEIRKPLAGPELISIFGPLSTLVEHSCCYALISARVKTLTAEEQLSSICRSAVYAIESTDVTRILDAMKVALQYLLESNVSAAVNNDEKAEHAIIGISRLLVRFIDKSADWARYSVSSGLYALLLQCSSCQFRRGEQISKELGDEFERRKSKSELDACKADFVTADPAVAKAVEHGIRAVTHAISTAGVAGERKLAMVVDTPRVAGFDQFKHIKDISGLLLRRPELRHVAVKHMIRTSCGLVPASDAPGDSSELPALDGSAMANIREMLSVLVPAYFGDDRRMAEVCGVALMDLIHSLGAARDTLRADHPGFITQVIREYGPRIAPDDPRLGGDSRDVYIVEISTRILSAFAIQGLDEPYSRGVRDSLKSSCDMLFSGVLEVLQTDVKSLILAERMTEASLMMFFLANVLCRVAASQTLEELSIWSQRYPDDDAPPLLVSLRNSPVLPAYLTTFALLDPTTLAVRMFRDEVLGMTEEFLALENYDWPQGQSDVKVPEDESDDNDLECGTVVPNVHTDAPRDSDIFRNSVLGDIDAENAEDSEFMDIEEEEVDSMDESISDEGSASHENFDAESMSFDDSESDDQGNQVEQGDRMSVLEYASDTEGSSTDSDDIHLLGYLADEDNSDSSASPAVIETVFSSEDEFSDLSISEESSDSELDDFDPESPNEDSHSDVNIVLQGVRPISEHGLTNEVVLEFSHRPRTRHDSDVSIEEVLGDVDGQSYASSALFSVGVPRFDKDQTVLRETDNCLAWWTEAILLWTETEAQIDFYMRVTVPSLDEQADKVAVENVRARQRRLEPSSRPFGTRHNLDTKKISATLARAVFTTVFDQGAYDMSHVVFQLLQFRDGRDTIAGLLMDCLFAAANGDIKGPYVKVGNLLKASTTIPWDATPSSVCANCVRVLCDVFENNTLESSEEHYDKGCLRLSRYVLRKYGSHLLELLTMPQICSSRKLLHGCAVLVLHVLSVTRARRFDSAPETLARFAQVLGMRECTSESFSALVEIIRKYLRIDALLPNVIRETRRARSSLLVLLPAVASGDASIESLDAFSTEQVKLLRLMALLDRVYEPQQVLGALKSVNLLPLWHSVGARLKNGTLEGQTHRSFASGVSLLETFALALSAATRWKAPTPDTHPALTKYAQWIQAYLRSFMSQHKSLINELLRAQPNLYLGPMGDMARALNLFDFQSKEKWFRSKVHEDYARVRSEAPGELRLSVRRQNVLADSFDALYELRGLKLRMPLYVHFQGEEAVDAGGVTREWLELIAREILNPEYALFIPAQEGSAIFQVNWSSGVNPNHLDYFLVVGRILGRAVYDGRLIGLYFSRVIYKYLLGRPNVTLADMEAVDEQYYKSLRWMLEMDVTGVIEETFSVEGTHFGKSFVVDLIENGRNVAVTEDNKKEYVRRIVEYKLVDSVKDQLEALRRGFNDVVDPELAEIFDEQELELVLCGLPTIRVEDWRANTTYVGYTADAPQVRWFWTAVRSFSTEERAKLLQFSTGTSRVPVHGFSHLRPSGRGPNFQIHKEHGNTSRWPTSHTCMNQINLPAYESYRKLRTMLLRAMEEGSEGFGFV